MKTTFSPEYQLVLKIRPRDPFLRELQNSLVSLINRKLEPRYSNRYILPFRFDTEKELDAQRKELAKKDELIEEEVEAYERNQKAKRKKK